MADAPSNHHVCPVCGAHAPPGRSGRVMCDGKRIGVTPVEPGPNRPHFTTRALPPEATDDE